MNFQHYFEDFKLFFDSSATVIKIKVIETRILSVYLLAVVYFSKANIANTCCNKSDTPHFDYMTMTEQICAIL